MTAELWCAVCGDPFDTDETVRADADTPLCSPTCEAQHEIDSAGFDETAL